MIRRNVVVIVAAAAALVFAWHATGERELYRASSAVNGEVIVTQRGSHRALRFSDGGTTQTVVRVDRPGELVSLYQRVIAARMEVHALSGRVLVVGLGGGALPSYLDALPGSPYEVLSVEYDEVVVTVARTFFGFADGPRNRVLVADGAHALRGALRSFDVIVLDAFGSVDYPAHLVTVEFFESVRRALASGGLVLANLLGPGINRDYVAIVAAFRGVFVDVELLAVPGRDQFIMVGR